MKIIVMLCMLFVMVCGAARASVRSDFDEIVRERNLCNKIDFSIVNEYVDKLALYVDSGDDVEVVEACENVREIQRLFNRCWSLFGVAVMSLYDGEAKFNVVPEAIKQIGEAKARLERRFPEMADAAKVYKNERLRVMMLQLLADSKREFLLVDRYINLLTKY